MICSASQNGQEDYHQPNTYNANQNAAREMYALTKAAALEETEKINFNSKADTNPKEGKGFLLEHLMLQGEAPVQVTAGGRLLQEGADYTVNYDIKG